MDYSVGAPGVAASAIGVLMILLFIAIGALLTVLPFWFICKKAGFHGALSLLMLVPIANIVLPFFLAFAEWPVLRGKTWIGEQPTAG